MTRARGRSIVIIYNQEMLGLRPLARTAARALSTTTTISERVAVTRQPDGIVRVALTRPKKMNVRPVDPASSSQILVVPRGQRPPTLNPT